MEVGPVITVGLSALLGLVWLVRLEGRQNAHEKECAQRQKNADERHNDIKHELGDVNRKLDRLLDRA